MTRRIDPFNPYKGRGTSALLGRTSIRLGGGRGIPHMPKYGAGRSTSASANFLSKATDDALNEGDEDNLREFSRGGTVLRQKQPGFKGISRARPNVDTSDAFLRGGDTLQEFFDHRGRPSRSPATKPVGSKNGSSQ